MLSQTAQRYDLQVFSPVDSLLWQKNKSTGQKKNTGKLHLVKLGYIAKIMLRLASFAFFSVLSSRNRTSDSTPGAIIEMVADLIWALDFFGPKEIWSLRTLVPQKFGPCMKLIVCHFHAGTNILGAQISVGPNNLGPNFPMHQISWGPKKSWAQMKSGTIAVTANFCTKLNKNRNTRHFRVQCVPLPPEFLDLLPSLRMIKVRNIGLTTLKFRLSFWT